MENVISIGKCCGCGSMGRLINNGCKACNDISPRWASHCFRIRTDREFARAAYSRLQSDYQREKFIGMFGREFLDDRTLFLV